MANDNTLNGFGVAGFVLSIISLFFFPILFGVLAIIFGGLNYDNGLGKASVIIAIISMLIAIIISCVYRY